MSPLQPFLATIKRELKRFSRNRNHLIQPLVFFALVVTLNALAVGPNSETFANIAPAAAWIAVLLALTLNLHALFTQDHIDGSLEQLLLTGKSLSVLVGGKIFVHWVAVALPQIIAAGLFMFIIGTSPTVIMALCFSLLIGTPVLVCIGSIAAALTVGTRSSGTLVALLALPLYMPVLIFGTSAALNAKAGTPFAAELYFLGGLSALAITLSPLSCAMALRARVAV